jgi:hypothetical protein
VDERAELIILDCRTIADIGSRATGSAGSRDDTDCFEPDHCSPSIQLSGSEFSHHAAGVRYPATPERP